MSPTSTLTPEARFLLAAINDRTWKQSLPWILEQNGAFDWMALNLIAVREQAEAIVWQRLKSLPSGTIPVEVGNGFAPLAQSSTFRMLCLENRLVDALDVLTAEGIRVTLLKGAALASTVYPYFSARPMSDLDLLVEPNSATAAVNALCRSGWKVPDADGTRAQHHLPALEDLHGSGTQLELHTELLSRGFSFNLPHNQVHANAVDFEIQGRPARVPCATHQVLHLCIHFAWSHTLRQGAWRTIRDLDMLVSRGIVDWDEVVTAARAHNATSCCYWTLRLAQTLAGVDVPDYILCKLEPSGGERLFTCLERNFMLELFSVTPYCPSVSLRRALWKLAIQPRRTGHGQSTPWRTLPGNQGESLPVPRRITHHIRDVVRWKSFAVEVLAGHGPSTFARTR